MRRQLRLCAKSRLAQDHVLHHAANRARPNRDRPGGNRDRPGGNGSFGGWHLCARTSCHDSRRRQAPRRLLGRALDSCIVMDHLFWFVYHAYVTFARNLHPPLTHQPSQPTTHERSQPTASQTTTLTRANKQLHSRHGVTTTLTAHSATALTAGGGRRRLCWSSAGAHVPRKPV